MRRLLLISGIAIIHYTVTLMVSLQAVFAGGIEGDKPLTSADKMWQFFTAVLNFPINWLLWKSGSLWAWHLGSLVLNSLLWGTVIYYLGAFFFREKPDLKAA